MKILLLGKDGQVGFELQRTLLPFGEVVALNRTQANMEDPVQLNQVLKSYKPDIVVNAAAYTAVDRAETNRPLAFRINGDAVAELAGYASANKILLVHYSTDYVFDGLKAGRYLETDKTNPQSIYGLSKLAGEKAIADSGCNALIFRTSWVYSSHGKNFVKTILRLAGERENLNIVADQTGAPTSAELIADVTALAIAAYGYGKIPCGIYHLTAAGETSWHGFASHVVIKALARGMPLKIDHSKIYPLSTEDYPVPAKRPKNSCLDVNKIEAQLGLTLPDWQLHVDRTVEQLLRAGATV
ncbi:MAG: dTDP-4-dehydrorhamnose reductase [Gammaproteobacteria bacterium]